MQDHREVERLSDELKENPASNADISGTSGLSKDKLQKRMRSETET